MNRYLFLDVDGVLTCKRDYDVVVVGHPVLNKVKCEMLVKGLAGMDVSIILSSTWRMKESDIKFLVEYVPIHGLTPILNAHRGTEIKHWLDGHPPGNYAIVDDYGDMLHEQLPFFVQTTWEDGLTESHVYRIKWILENGSRFS